MAELRASAARRYEQALRALCLNAIAEHGAGITGETAESGPLNSAAHEPRLRVPRWRCWLVQRRVTRELDYWNRMGGAA
jgi:hypothetical protein